MDIDPRYMAKIGWDKNTDLSFLQNQYFAPNFYLVLVTLSHCPCQCVDRMV